MKQSITLTLITIITAFILNGCTTTQSNLSTEGSFKTSKQVEKSINWKYCEESN